MFQQKRANLGNAKFVYTLQQAGNVSLESTFKNKLSKKVNQHLHYVNLMDSANT